MEAHSTEIRHGLASLEARTIRAAGT